MSGKKLIRSKGWSFVFILMVVSFAQAQINRFSHIGVQEGLSHGWAKCIEKDQKGYLWVGTVNGLNRYDGKEFTVYKNQENNSNSLSDNFIQALETDRQGFLWIGTYSGGLNRFDPGTETFKSYRNAPKKLNSISDDQIHSIKQDSKGRLWIGTARGLDLYDYEKDHFNPFYTTKEETPVFIRGIVSCISEDRRGSLWVGTDNGLYVISPNAQQVKHYEYDEKEPSGLSHPYVTSIYHDIGGNVWIGTWGGGINLYVPDQDGFIHYQHDSKPYSLSHNSVLCVTGDREGHLIVGTEGGGLNVMDIASRQFTHYLPAVGQANGINSNSIHSLYADRESGITWVGTYAGGLNFFSQWNKPFVHLKQAIGELNNNSILSILEDPQGKIYIGTDGGGINIYDPTTQKVEVLSHQEDDPHSLMSNAVLSMKMDDQSNLWVGTFDGGLDYLPKGSRKFQHFLPDPKNGISDTDVSALCLGSDGKIWIGSMNGGIDIYNPRTQQFQNLRHAPGNPRSLSDNFITNIFEGQSGQFYIQTGKTMDVYDPKSAQFSRLEQGFGIRLTTPIASLQDRRGNLWVGTREGLFFFDLEKVKVKKFNTDNGLPNNSIAGILEDEQANLWVSTMGGLVKMKSAVNQPDSVYMHTYIKEDGLQANDFKDMACHRGPSGTLYFGGQNGINFFDPNKIQLNPVIPEIVFTEFKVFNQRVVYGQSNILRKPLNQSEEIQLQYAHNVFSFEFSALNYWLPQKNQYAYKMEGFERNWNYVGNQTSATYTNLDPGTYTFRVKAANNDGVWNEQGQSIRVVISPPWWKTTWFQVALVLLIVASVFAFIRIRLYQLKQRQKELKREVAARTEEISQINALLHKRNEEIGHKNDTLTDKNEQLQDQNHELERQGEKIRRLLKEIQELNELKLRFFTNISHELRTPLTLIIGPLEKLVVQTQLTNKVHNELGLMQRNAHKLLRLINQLLDFRKIESGNIQLKASKNDIVTCIQEVFDSFKFMADRKGLDYRFESSFDHFDLWFDSEKMEKILTNLLSNAFKYTPSGQVLVQLHMSPDQRALALEISDTGKGIPANELPHIFDLYYQANNASGLHQAGSGIGLALIKQYIDLHHAHIEVKSEVDKGTTFCTLLPIGSQHLSNGEILPFSTPITHTSTPLETDFQISTEDRAVLSDKVGDIPLGEKPMLLLVEDNADIRDYIHTSLQGDFQVIEAANGQEGLEKALDVIPDLIISDVMMPEMNGFVLCQKIKEDERTNHIPLLLLTAYSGEEKQWEGFRSGADDYVTKPFNINILQQKLKNIAHTREHLIEKFKQSTSLDIGSLSTNEADQLFLKKAIEVINENLANTNLSVEEFSEHFNMSRRNLLRKMKAITGLSVNEFIKNIRLKKSIEYLKHSDRNISEVAYAVGFSDPKYFSKCFKSEFGQLPKEFQGASA